MINKADLDPQLARHAQHTIKSALAIAASVLAQLAATGARAVGAISGDGIATFWSEVRALPRHDASDRRVRRPPPRPGARLDVDT